MISIIVSLFFCIGLTVSVFYLSTLCFSLHEKINEARERKQAHEKRLMSLLEAINQKLGYKP